MLFQDFKFAAICYSSKRKLILLPLLGGNIVQPEYQLIVPAEVQYGTQHSYTKKSFIV